ncbi:MAG: hypothetical protein N2Z22_11380 [Turneriella sp.]|nr:hypothetical protein [Turneriella sp.]
MKKYSFDEALQEAMHREYGHPAPPALRARIFALSKVQLLKPWQLVGSIVLMMLAPLCFYFFDNKLVYSSTILLLINIAAGMAVFLLIFAGVAHRLSDPKNKAELVEWLHALRARF